LAVHGEFPEIDRVGDILDVFALVMDKQAERRVGRVGLVDAPYELRYKRNGKLVGQFEE
jgi:hypothetical protein